VSEYHFVTHDSLTGLGIFLLGVNNLQGDYRDDTYSYVYIMLLGIVLMDRILFG
jgi:hypothetical protein